MADGAARVSGASVGCVCRVRLSQRLSDRMGSLRVALMPAWTCRRTNGSVWVHSRATLGSGCLSCRAEAEDAVATRHHGTTHLVMSPPEFMPRLAALVPRPRMRLIRFHGVQAHSPQA